MISAYGVQLYYWPVQTMGGNLCNSSRAAMAATPTGDGPNIRIVDGFTMTSPSAYLAFQNMAARAANNTCGPETQSYTVAIAPEDLSSISYMKAFPGKCSKNDFLPACASYSASTKQLDFADLNWPVPYDAYKGMIGCV